MVRTERWIPTYKEDYLKDGTWVNYMIGVYDGHDIMSDCVKPSWERSGEYMIEIIEPGKRHNCDACFVIHSQNKDWANRIASNIKHGRFSTLEELLQALRKLSYLGKLTSGNGRENLFINA